MLLEIDLLKYQNKLNIKYVASKKYIYDIIRKKYLVLTPEELVRQLIIHYLMQEKNVSINKISVEMGLEVNSLSKRCDILVYNMNFEPLLLIECKAATVAINHKVFEQIAIYNRTLKVPYLLVTNGLATYCSSVDHKKGSFQFLNEIPDYNTIKN